MNNRFAHVFPVATILAMGLSQWGCGPLPCRPFSRCGEPPAEKEIGSNESTPWGRTPAEFRAWAEGRFVGTVDWASDSEVTISASGTASLGLNVACVEGPYALSLREPRLVVDCNADVSSGDGALADRLNLDLVVTDGPTGTGLLELIGEVEQSLLTGSFRATVPEPSRIRSIGVAITVNGGESIEGRVFATVARDAGDRSEVVVTAPVATLAATRSDNQ